MGGWLETDNRAISVQLNLIATATGTELGNRCVFKRSLQFFSNLQSLEYMDWDLTKDRKCFSSVFP